MAVYFLKLSTPLGNYRQKAQWYVGYSHDDNTMQQRIIAHLCGEGARFTQVARERGIEIIFMGYIEGDRKVERAIKNQKGHARVFERLLKQGKIKQPSWMNRSYVHNRQRYSISVGY